MNYHETFRDRAEKKNNTVINKINTWQKCSKLTKLACDKCLSTKVDPIIKGPKVHLKCLTCSHISGDIPNYVLQANFNSKLAVLVRNKENSQVLKKLQDF
jgi:hypothetical protein